MKFSTVWKDWSFPEERLGEAVDKGAASVAVETLDYWTCQDHWDY